MYPGYWVNPSDIHDEPRELLRSPSGDETMWPRVQMHPGISSSTLDDLSALHLSLDQEDILINWHTEHIEPFMKCSHIQASRNEISMFRIGRSIIPREIEAAIFAIQALAVAAMPSSLVRTLLGQSRQELIKHFQDATERALARANLMRTRSTYLFSAFMHYIVSPPGFPTFLLKRGGSINTRMKTFIFQIGDPEKASSLLGIASRVVMRST